MNVNMQTLRAALVRAKMIDRRDLRRFRWLSPGMEAQRQVVMQALDGGHPLMSRMAECGEMDDHGNMRLCQVPTCPRCFLNRRRTQARKAISETFDGLGNEELGFLTVLTEVSPILPVVTEIIRESETKIRNFMDRRRRKDARWNQVQLLGFWELDRIKAGEVEQLGRNTRLFLREARMPVGLDPDTTIWMPHFHAVVALGEVSRDEFVEALREYGHGAAYQVDLRMFHRSRSVQKNLMDVIRYAHKFRIENAYKGGEDPNAASGADDGMERDRQWWDLDDIKSYTEWLCESRNGFQSLRFVVGRKKSNAVRVNKKDASLSVGSVGSVDVGSVRVRESRYVESLLDTNWLPKQTRSPSCDVSDPLKPMHDLFEFAEPKRPMRWMSGKGEPSVWPQGPECPRSKPQPISSGRLREMVEAIRQRCP